MPYIIQTEFLAHVNLKYPNYLHYYTDGAKTDTYTTSVFVVNDFFKVFSLSTYSSIFDAEAFAISEAIKHITLHNYYNVLICTDSHSVLTNLINQASDLHPTIYDIKKALFNFQNLNISLLWIPSHVGIPGNERADQLTKLLPLAHKVEGKLYYKQLIPFIKKQSFLDWAKEWHDCTWKGQRLKTLMPHLSTRPWFSKFHWNRKDIKNLIRARIGHGLYPSHLHRINLRASDLCNCGLTGDLNHIFFQCPLLQHDAFFKNLINANYFPPFNISFILHNPLPSIYKIITEFLNQNNISL